MYEAIKEWLLWLMRVPHEPLDPMGEVGSLRVFRAAPGYLRYLVLGWAIKQAVLLIPTVVFMVVLLVEFAHRGPEMAFVIVFELLAFFLFPVQAFFSFFLLRLNYEMRWYKVTDRSLRIREGIQSVHELTMTFANIQNITIEQGPIQRFFGISDVRVETAGGGSAVPQQPGHESMGLNMHLGIFRGVDNAEEIRDLMLDRLRRLRDTGLGDTDDTPEMAAGASAAAQPSSGGWSEEGLAALAALRDEAAALRRAAESLSAQG